MSLQPYGFNPITPGTLDEHGKEIRLEDLDPAEQERVIRRSEAIKKLLDSAEKPKYKLELFFTGPYTKTAPVTGVVSFWATGAALSGEGDVKLYICPQKHFKLGTCDALVTDSGSFTDGRFVCPACGSVWNSEAVIGEYIHKLPLERWPEVVQRHFVRLGMSAHIVRKIDQTGLINPTLREKEKYQRGDLLNKSRRARRKSVYRMQDIIRDASTGKSLLQLFKEFIAS